jgi:hypothetical protein
MDFVARPARPARPPSSRPEGSGVQGRPLVVSAEPREQKRTQSNPLKLSDGASTRCAIFLEIEAIEHIWITFKELQRNRGRFPGAKDRHAPGFGQRAGHPGVGAQGLAPLRAPASCTGSLLACAKNFKNEAKRSFRINKTLIKWDKTKPTSAAPSASVWQGKNVLPRGEAARARRESPLRG